MGQYNKLKARKIGPVEIVERMNANANRLALPPHVHTADVFNVRYLFKYEPDDITLAGFVDESSLGGRPDVAYISSRALVFLFPFLSYLCFPFKLMFRFSFILLS